MNGNTGLIGIDAIGRHRVSACGGFELFGTAEQIRRVGRGFALYMGRGMAGLRPFEARLKRCVTRVTRFKKAVGSPSLS